MRPGKSLRTKGACLSLSVVRSLDLHSTTERLIDDTISFGQLGQARHLLLGCIGFKIKIQTDRLEADRGLFRNSQGAAEIEIALGPDSTSFDLYTDRRSHRGKRDPGAGHQCLE